MTKQLTLYGMAISLYTGKVRSYLRKQRLDYVERAPCVPDYQAFVLPRVKRFVVPVVALPDGTLLQDSTDIIDGIETRMSVPFPCYPPGPRQRLAALALELFGDEGLLRLAMHYRWSFLADQDLYLRREFAAFMAPMAPLEEQDKRAAVPMGQMQAYVPRLGITAESAPMIEAAYHELLEILEAHFLQYPFLFGGRASIGDFGLIGPLYAHLGRDPHPSGIMRRRAPRTARWVERMNAPDPDMPEYPDTIPDAFLDGDAIPPTILPLLDLMARDFLPELRALVAFANDWVVEKGVTEGDPVTAKPSRRVLGSIRFPYRGMEIESWANPYVLWMLQRVTDAYAALDGADQAAAQSLFAACGLSEILTLKASRRIERRDHVEVWGTAT